MRLGLDTSQESIDDVFVGCMPLRERGVGFKWHPMDDSMQIGNSGSNGQKDDLRQPKSGRVRIGSLPSQISLSLEPKVLDRDSKFRILDISKYVEVYTKSRSSSFLLAFSFVMTECA
jgi:hypothetical protein